MKLSQKIKLTRDTPTHVDSESPTVKRMCDALYRAGYEASPSDVGWAWEQHSETRAAGFLFCDNADAAVEILLRYLKPQETEEQ